MEQGSGDQKAAEGTGTSVLAAPARPLFVGSFEHSLDEKNRLALPSTYRGDLAAGAFVGPLVDQLGVWLREEYEDVLAKYQDGVDLGVVTEQAFSQFLALTFPVQPDGQGRFVVPPKCREFAGISREVVVRGRVTRVEVWAATRWDGFIGQEGDPDAAVRQAARDLRL